ncbi:unnamed protein product [Effrenium voratum]|nr:unnamed protein product [Effrenium voratum]
MAEKKIKNLRKKLGQIEQLEKDEREGKKLNDEQKEKLLGRQKLEEEIKALEAGEVSIEPAPAATQSPADECGQEDVGAKAAEAEAPPAPGDPKPAEAAGMRKAQSSKGKGLEKKLREIAQLEDKRSKGEQMDKKQIEKIDKKRELEEQLLAALAEEAEEEADGGGGSGDLISATHMEDGIRGTKDSSIQRRRAKYFGTDAFKEWRQDFVGTFLVQPPEDLAQAAERRKFEIIQPFEYFMWTSMPSTFEYLKQKVADATGVKTGDFHFESMKGQKSLGRH